MTFQDKHKAVSLIIFVESKILKVDKTKINREKYTQLTDEELNLISWDSVDAFENWKSSGIKLKNFEPFGFIERFK